MWSLIENTLSHSFRQSEGAPFFAHFRRGIERIYAGTGYRGYHRTIKSRRAKSIALSRTRARILLARSRSVCDDDGRVLAHPASRNRPVAIPQPKQHFRLLAAGRQPENAPGPVEDRKRQRHAPMPLAGSGQGDIRTRDLSGWIPGYERGGVAVCAKTEMNEIEHRRRAA